MLSLHGEDDYYGTDFDAPQNDENRGNYEWNRLIFLRVVASLCIVISVSVIFYYVYFRLYSIRLRSQARRRPRRRLGVSRLRRFSWRGADDQLFTSPREGLCRAAVDTLPVFVYNPKSFTDGLSCAVCLCEFEENEKARLLPSCNHSFHVDCIAMWFCSHSTCPLCRARVEAQPDQSVGCGPVLQEEVSAIEAEETDAKILTSTSIASSAAAAAEQRNNDDENSKMEVGIAIKEYIAVDIPTGEK